MPTRLERSQTNRVIAGVCGGIAEYLQVDPTLVRVFFVIGTILTGGLGILGYIVLLVLMPLPGAPQPFVKSVGTSSAPAGSTSSDAPTEALSTLQTAPPPPADPQAAERRRAAFGYFLIAIGLIFLLSNLGIFRIVRWDLVWPLVFIGLGALLLAQRMRR